MKIKEFETIERIKIDGVEYYKDRYCKCGCENLIKCRKWHQIDGISKFIKGHYVKLNPPMKNPKTVIKSIKSQKIFYKTEKGKESSKRQGESLKKYYKTSKGIKKIKNMSGKNNTLYKKIENLKNTYDIHKRIKNFFGTKCVISNIEKDKCGNNLSQHCISGDHKIIEAWNWISISNHFHPYPFHSKLKFKNIKLLKDGDFEKITNQIEIKSMYILESLQIINELKRNYIREGG